MSQEEQLDTRHYIFNMLFHVRIPYIQMLSIQEIKDFGMSHCGVASFDKQTANEHRDIMIPIAKMAEYFKNGAQIYIPLESDIKLIYEHITNHLNAWKNEIRNNLHIGSAPIEDLKLLDQFGNAIYEHAKYQFTDEIVGSLTGILPEKFKRLSRVSQLLRTPDQINNQPKTISPGKNVTILGDVVNEFARPSEPVVQEREFPKRETLDKFLDNHQKNPSHLPSLNGAQNNTSNTPTRSSLLSKDGLSYQSIMRKGRESWRS